jgi:photosystem II stability/assembly factor-like uncharacterized protein
MRLFLLAAIAVGCAAPEAAPRTVAQSPHSVERKLIIPAGAINDITWATDQSAWAVGPAGVLASDDGGRGWRHALFDDVALSAVDAVSGGARGWAVGAAGTIVATSDGGTTWKRQASGTHVNLTDVAAISDRSAMVIGYGVGFSDIPDPVVETITLRTDDAGETWTPRPLPEGWFASNIQFVDDGTHGWATAERCVPAAPDAAPCASWERALLATRDGGHTWDVRLEEPARALEFAFVNADVGWAHTTCLESVCAKGIMRSTDGGASWEVALDPGADEVLTVATAFDADSAIVGINATSQSTESWLAITHDGGATWSRYRVPSAGYGTTFADSTTGIRLRNADTIEWTTDGGLSWSEASAPVTADLSTDADFLDADHGWVAASKLLRTTNGGETWDIVSDTRLRAVEFVTTAEGWGTVEVCDPGPCAGALVRTRDGGVTWNAVPAAGRDIVAVHFVDALNGWVYSTSNPVPHRTTDGGLTWFEQTIGAPAAAITQVNADTAWAISSCATARDASCPAQPYLSRDGGTTWQALTPVAPDSACLPMLTAVDETHA